MEQFDLNFEAGLIDQFPNFADLLNGVVYSGKRPAKMIAADLDLSQSMLSRMINQDDTSVNFPARRLGELIEATGDHRPVYWLVEKYCQDAEAQRNHAMIEIAALLPGLKALIKRANGEASE